MILGLRVHSYVVTAKEKQATFTARQQRLGVFILPFLVAGLFCWSAAASAMSGTDASDFEAEEEADTAAGAAPPVEETNGYDADSEAEASRVKKGFQFDWAAYRAVWNDTPVHVAVTAMFSEYAQLYALLARHTTQRAPVPMTMEEGVSIGNKATDFVNKFMTPILGKMVSTKVHKLLRHVTDAIRWHGSPQNANTASNESQHKDDKPHYSRTNKSPATFTRQLVRHAQGSRSVTRNNDKADAECVTAFQELMAERAREAVGNIPADARCTASEAETTACARGGGGAPAPAVSTGGAPAPARSTARVAVTGRSIAPAVTPCAAAGSVDGQGGRTSPPTDGANAPVSGPMPPIGRDGRRGVHTPLGSAARVPNRTPYHRDNVRVSDLARRPGLAKVATVLKMKDNDLIRVTQSLDFKGSLLCGTEVSQRVRATMDDRGSPWLDHVSFHPPGQPGVRRVGHVRAIVKRSDGDHALLCLMQPTAVDKDCPLQARGCTRLQWHVAENATEITVCSVPISCVNRVVHVVPDFAALAARSGMHQPPASLLADLDEQLAMRYFLNVFFALDD